MLRKTLALTVVIVAIAIILGGAAVLVQPKYSGVLVVGTTEREETLDPADAYNYFSVNLLQNTMATLLTYSESGDGSVVPMLLTEVPSVANGGISADSLTYTLRVRSGVTFEDGTVITATTVKNSIDRAIKTKLDRVTDETRVPVPSFLLAAVRGATEYLSMFANRSLDPANYTQAMVDQTWAAYSTGLLQGVEVGDATTVRIHMARAWSPMVLLLAFTSLAPVNPNVFPMDEFAPTKVSASGPYRLTTFIPGERVELDANPTFFGPQPVTSRVVIKFFGGATSLALAIERGEVDVAYRNLNPEDYERFARDPTLRAAQGSSAVIRYMVFKADSAPFNDARLRRAFAYAIDRDRITQTVFLNSTEPLYSLIPRGMFGHQDVFLTRYPRDLNSARALLTAAGYSATNKLSFTLWYTPERYGSTESDVAAIIKTSLEETGMIAVTLNSQEWLTYRVSFRTGAFNAFLLGWFPDYLDPDNYVTPFLHYESGGTPSFGSWYRNDTLDDKIELQAQQSDLTERAETLSDIQDSLADDVPYLPLWQTTQQVVNDPGASGIVLDQSQFFRYFTIRLAHVADVESREPLYQLAVFSLVVVIGAMVALWTDERRRRAPKEQKPG